MKYLRSKLPSDVPPLVVGLETLRSVNGAKSSSCVNQNAEGMVDQLAVASTPNTLEPKRRCVDSSTSSSRPLIPATPCTDESSLNPPPTPTPTEGAAETLASSAADEVLAELNAKIQKLEQQLDDFAVTAAKRFALKKDLAMTRSLKIRHMRKIGQET